MLLNAFTPLHAKVKQSKILNFSNRGQQSISEQASITGVQPTSSSESETTSDKDYNPNSDSDRDISAFSNTYHNVGGGIFHPSVQSDSNLSQDDSNEEERSNDEQITRPPLIKDKGRTVK